MFPSLSNNDTTCVNNCNPMSRTFNIFRQFIIAPVQNRHYHLLQLESIGLWTLMVFIPGSKVWTTPLRDLPPLFCNGLKNLDSIQLTENCQMLSLFSRRLRRKILVITSLSLSLQCLVKLCRMLFWELLKNT